MSGLRTFLSYSTADSHACELVKQVLNRANILVWKDTDSISPGDDWSRNIDEAIDDCSVFVLLISERSMASHYVTYEWSRAMARDKIIVPILINHAQAHPQLQRLQHLDFTDPTSLNQDRLSKIIEERMSEAEFPELDLSDDTATAKDAIDTRFDEMDREIRKYLNKRGFVRVSFERVRRNINGNWTDQDLQDFINQSKDFVAKGVRSSINQRKEPLPGLKLR